AGGFCLVGRGSSKTRAGNCTRFRNQLLPRSPLRGGTSGVVLRATRRHDQIRRKSAEEIRGHLSAEFPVPELARAMGGNEEHHFILGRARGSCFSGGQSAHQ